MLHSGYLLTSVASLVSLYSFIGITCNKARGDSSCKVGMSAIESSPIFIPGINP